MEQVGECTYCCDLAPRHAALQGPGELELCRTLVEPGWTQPGSCMQINRASESKTFPLTLVDMPLCKCSSISLSGLLHVTLSLLLTELGLRYTWKVFQYISTMTSNHSL